MLEAVSLLKIKFQFARSIAGMQGMLCALETCLRDGKIGCFLPNWVFVHRSYSLLLQLPKYHNFALIYVLEVNAITDKLRLQSHRWHLAVGSERSQEVLVSKRPL